MSTICCDTDMISLNTGPNEASQCGIIEAITGAFTSNKTALACDRVPVTINKIRPVYSGYSTIIPCKK